MPSRSRRSKLASAVLILVLMMFASAPFFFGRGEDTGGYEAVIRVDGDEIRRIPLGRERPVERFDVATSYGTNKVLAGGGKILVESADCPDQICVKSAAASSPGDVIACLPHRLLIEIVKVAKD